MIRRVAFFFVLFLILSLLGFFPGLEAAEVPRPEEVIGFKAGEDYKLADWRMVQRYFHELDKASGRVHVEKIGKSTMGKDMIVVILSSKENLARREEIRDTYRRLADPRDLSKGDAQKLLGKIPAAVFVACAQHATEIGSTQMSMEIAYRVAAEETPAMEEIRRNVLFLLVPSMNPDGHQLVCEWYNEHLGTPFEGSPMPWLYHKYVGHDNNRDWAMITQAETRNVSRVLYEEWFPQIVIDVHQMGRAGARMFIPPYYDPINPNIDPLIQHELSLISAQMQLDMSVGGHKGILTYAMFDEWLLGYFTSVPTRHNMVAQLIELASVNIASPVFMTMRELRGSRGFEEYSRRANFPEPWEGGWWRLRDIVDYEETALLSVLGLASKNRGLFLENFYSLGIKQVWKGRKEPPFAFLVPPDQRDPATAWMMLEALQRGGVEIHKAQEEFLADGIPYPAGTHVILMAQPFRAHAKDLLERQSYPDLRTYPGGPPERPYDVAGWTFSLLMDVKSVPVVHPFQANLEKVEKDARPPEGTVSGLTGESRFVLIERCQNNAYILVNRLLSAGEPVSALGEDAVVEERRFAPGTFVLGGEGRLPQSLLEEVRRLGLRTYAYDSLPEAKLLEVKPVRFSLYQPWTASMDEGWTRWVLERFEFPYTTIHDAEIRAGGLRKRYDAIILPDIWPESIIRGNPEGSMPKHYTGGIGDEGGFALRDFVREGGRLIGMDSSCGFLIDKLELPVKNLVRETGEEGYGEMEETRRGQEREKRFFCPGSILRIHVDNTNPLAFGLSPAVEIMHINSPVFERIEEKGDEKEDSPGKPEGSSPKTAFVGTYPKMNPLQSGWIENDDLIHGKGALVQAEFEKGTAILIGFRCQFRAQTHGTFKVLFNAILGAGTNPVEK